jgi:hypothetical protein
MLASYYSLRGAYHLWGDAKPSFGLLRRPTANFQEFCTGEVPRIAVPRTWVNKARSSSQPRRGSRRRRSWLPRRPKPSLRRTTSRYPRPTGPASLPSLRPSSGRSSSAAADLPTARPAAASTVRTRFASVSGFGGNRIKRCRASGEVLWLTFRAIPGSGGSDTGHRRKWRACGHSGYRGSRT